MWSEFFPPWKTGRELLGRLVWEGKLSPRGRAFASLLLYFHFCLIVLKECFMEYKSLRKLYFSSIVKFLKVYFCLRQGIGVHLALRRWVCVAMANWILYL